MSQKSISSENTALLYKYGSIVGSSSTSISSFKTPIRNLRTANNLPRLFGSQTAGTIPTASEENHHTQRSSSGDAMDAPDDESMMSLQSSIAMSKGKSMKLVCGSQFRLVSKSNQTCMQCELMEKANRKSKENIRILKLQILRMEENFKDLKYSKGRDGVGAESGGAMKVSLDANLQPVSEDPEHAQRCALIEEELAKLRKTMSYERGINDGLRHSLEEAKKNGQAELARVKDESLLATNRNRNMEETIASLRASKSENELTILRYKQQLERTEQRLEDALLRLKAAEYQQEVTVGHARDLDSLRRDLAKLEAANRAMGAQLSQAKEELAEAHEARHLLEEKADSLDSKNSTLEQQLAETKAELKAAQDQLSANKKRFEVLEGTVKITLQERDNMKSLVHTREIEIAERSSRIENQDREIRELQARLLQQEQRSAGENIANKKALEKAITSSVRLCVVAPTVNVHVSDSKHKFKARLGEAALKQFLDKEVFDKYSFLYKQAADNAAPNGGNLESWLQQMLAAMQISIENHVNSAMEGSSL